MPYALDKNAKSLQNTPIFKKALQKQIRQIKNTFRFLHWSTFTTTTPPPEKKQKTKTKQTKTKPTTNIQYYCFALNINQFKSLFW